MSDAPVLPRSRELVQQRSQVTATPKNLGRGQFTGSNATVYTAPSTTTPTGSTRKTLLTGITLCNTDSSARTVTLYLVESGGSAADNRAILKDASIAAKTMWHIDLGQGIPLESGETIQGLADTTLKVTYRFSGVELT